MCKVMHAQQVCHQNNVFILAIAWHRMNHSS